MSAAAPILPDLRLIQAATAIDIAYTRDRLAVIAGAPGNPFGVEIRVYGDTVRNLLLCLGVPSPWGAPPMARLARVVIPGL
ncbi:hypothetical protein, partial [Phenylobacterium sp.]|uniref:hypothetical protein n=1 Tax=Phenylobacterium sp. TaxID=1871053 RepID=UPI0025DB03E2